jgi:hypothetical protein
MFNRKILAMQTDWGGEYERLNSFFRSVGISHHIFCPHTHQQNGVAERKHCHIVKVDLDLLAYASMPLSFGIKPSLQHLTSSIGLRLNALSMTRLFISC